MEGISRLKELEYINLAVNSVLLIEGVKGCESLQKLDLTLNFIDVEDLEESIDNLAEL
jgi:protein TilB